jgi:protein-tyrosine phosphatase
MSIATHNARRLQWEACHNARDIGGFETADGHETRWRAIIRSDNPCRLTPAGQVALVAYGVRTVIDVRTPGELAVDPSPFMDSSPHRDIIDYRHRPFFTDEGLTGAPPPETRTIEEGYITMLEEYKAGVAAILSAMAEAPEGGVLIHCHSGKDRTGTLVALLLALVGVPNDVIAADYALSSDYLEPATQDWLENGPGTRANREREVQHWVTRPQTMLAVLQHLESTYGSVRDYMLQAGVSVGDLDRLRARLID